MSNDNTLSHASQFTCRHFNTAIPGASALSHSNLPSSSVSEFTPGAEVLFSQCDNSTTGIVEALTLSDTFEQAPTADYSLDICDWRNCTGTSQSGINAFEKCSNTTSNLTTAGTDIRGQCFRNGKAAMDATSDGVNNSDRNKIKWRSDKKKKETVSAALLIALGVAGLILGS